MAHFYGEVQGARGAVSRLGGKHSGMTASAAGWGGRIRTRLWHDAETGEDRYRVELTPWHGSGGESRVIAEGVLDARIPAKKRRTRA